MCVHGYVSCDGGLPFPRRHGLQSRGRRNVTGAPAAPVPDPPPPPAAARDQRAAVAVQLTSRQLGRETVDLKLLKLLKLTLFDIVQLFRIVIVIKIVDRKFISLSEHIENLLNSDKATCVGNIWRRVEDKNFQCTAAEFKLL